MLKEIIISFLIPAFLMQIAGCYSEQWVTKENLNTEPYDIRIITKDKGEYTGTQRLWLIKNDTLVIYNGDFVKQHEIPCNSIDEIYVNKIDGRKTALFTATVIILGGAVIYLIIKIIESNFRLNFNK